MKEKLFQILEGIIIIALGIIIAVCGGGEALDIYFGIIALVGGVALTALNIAMLVKTKALDFGALFLGTALIVVGISLFTDFLTFAALINLVVLLVLGLGIALVLYGIYTMLVLKGLVIGVGQMLIGVVIAVLAILFLCVADFRTVFWIIVGIVVAVYGVLVIVSAFLPKKAKAEKKAE